MQLQEPTTYGHGGWRGVAPSGHYFPNPTSYFTTVPPSSAALSDFGSNMSYLFKSLINLVKIAIISLACCIDKILEFLMSLTQRRRIKRPMHYS